MFHLVCFHDPCPSFHTQSMNFSSSCSRCKLSEKYCLEHKHLQWWEMDWFKWMFSPSLIHDLIIIEVLHLWSPNLWPLIMVSCLWTLICGTSSRPVTLIFDILCLFRFITVQQFCTSCTLAFLIYNIQFRPATHLCSPTLCWTQNIINLHV